MSVFGVNGTVSDTSLAMVDVGEGWKSELQFEASIACDGGRRRKFGPWGVDASWFIPALLAAIGADRYEDLRGKRVRLVGSGDSAIGISSESTDSWFYPNDVTVNGS